MVPYLEEEEEEEEIHSTEEVLKKMIELSERMIGD
jgi:hypothetical protein